MSVVNYLRGFDWHFGIHSGSEKKLLQHCAVGGSSTIDGGEDTIFKVHKFISKMHIFSNIHLTNIKFDVWLMSLNILVNAKSCIYSIKSFLNFNVFLSLNSKKCSSFQCKDPILWKGWCRYFPENLHKLKVDSLDFNKCILRNWSYIRSHDVFVNLFETRK